MNLSLEYLANKQWDLFIKESDFLINSPEWEEKPKDFRVRWHHDRAIALIRSSQPEKALASDNSSGSRRSFLGFFIFNLRRTC
jgi:hypothetical protein